MENGVIASWGKSVSSKAVNISKKADKTHIILSDGRESNLTKTLIADIEVFTGKGSKTELRVKDYLAQNYAEGVFGKTKKHRNFRCFSA